MVHSPQFYGTSTLGPQRLKLSTVQLTIFARSEAPSIIDLAQHGWSGAAIAESLERRRGYERLHDLIEYAAKRLQPESLEDLIWNTFECIVNGPEAMAWLEKNRPDVMARIRSQSRYQPSENSRFHEEELLGREAADGIVWC